MLQFAAADVLGALGAWRTCAETEIGFSANLLHTLVNDAKTRILVFLQHTKEGLVGWYKGLSRREFIKTAAAAAVFAGGSACTSNSSPWRFLRVEEARTLAAICDCIIPPDSDPGANWAQVVNYIDIQLCGYFRQFRDTYRKGIASLESVSKKQFGKPFSALSLADQTALLTTLEKGTAPEDLWSSADQKALFELVLAHTMQGYYGDPRHGGNRDRVSWKMVGLSYPQVRGRFRTDAGVKS